MPVAGSKYCWRVPSKTAGFVCANDAELEVKSGVIAFVPSKIAGCGPLVVARLLGRGGVDTGAEAGVLLLEIEPLPK